MLIHPLEPSEIVRFQDNFARICDGITNPEMFAARLFSAHLITDEVRQQADLPCFTPCCRVIKLVSAVLAQIKINPSESLRKFIAVLREDPCYESLAAKLDTKNGELGSRHKYNIIHVALHVYLLYVKNSFIYLFKE